MIFQWQLGSTTVCNLFVIAVITCTTIQFNLNGDKIIQKILPGGSTVKQLLIINIHSKKKYLIIMVFCNSKLPKVILCISRFVSPIPPQEFVISTMVHLSPLSIFIISLIFDLN